MLFEQTMTMTKTKGTKEWADHNVNIFYGCEHNCKYCYAKRIWNRFKENRQPFIWSEPVLNEKAYKKNYRKRKGRFMFPTTHDITPSTISECYMTLLKILKAGNSVLITTKPHLQCVDYLCTMLIDYKDQIQWRFTITSMNNATLKHWEEGAPEFSERLASLVYAFNAGYKTSVSIEPFLDMNPLNLVIAVGPYCTESIWLGIMSGQTYPFHTPSNIKLIVDKIKQLPESIRSKIRLKDSITNMGYKVRRKE